MSRRHKLHRVRRAVRATIVPGLILGCAAAATAQSPDGLVLGPWIFSPHVSTKIGLDSNVFRDDDGQEKDDLLSGVEAGVEALLPFRESSLEFSYDVSEVNYRDNNSVFGRTLAQNAGVELELNFGSSHTLVLSDDYRRDYVRTEQLDQTGQQFEEIVTGQPYNSNRWEVEFSRDLPHRDYSVSVQRRDLTFERTGFVGSFFDYRGFDTSVEYGQRISERKKLVGRIRSKRFDNFKPDETTGVPFRKEETDSVMLGFRGEAGDQQPFQVNLGYARSRFTGITGNQPVPVPVRGLVAAANWRIRLGGQTDLRLEALREPLPSNFNTFYINNGVRGEMSREWRRLEAAVSLRVNRYEYEGNISGCAGQRRDMGYEAGSTWQIDLHELVAIEIASYYYHRSSNCDDFEYTAASVETGIRLGW